MAKRYGGLADFYLASSDLRDECSMPRFTPGLAVFDRGKLVARETRGVYKSFELNEGLVLSLIGPSIPEAAALFVR